MYDYVTSTLPTRFISTTFDNLGNIELTPGAIITLVDHAGFYYDTSTERHKVNLVEFIPSIEGRIGEEGTLYFCTGNNVIYYWDDDKFQSAIGEVLTSAPTDGKQYVQKNGVWQPIDGIFDCIDSDVDGDNLRNYLNLLLASNKSKINVKIVGDGSGLVLTRLIIPIPESVEMTLDFKECNLPDNATIMNNWISNSGSGRLNVSGLVIDNCIIEPENCIMSNINALSGCTVTVSPSVNVTRVTLDKLNSVHHCTLKNCNIISMTMHDDNIDFSNNFTEDTIVRVDTVTEYDDEGTPIYSYQFFDHTMNNYGGSFDFSDLPWNFIAQLKKYHNLAKFFSIGDKKEFTMNGETWVATIIDKHHDTDLKGNPYELSLMCCLRDSPYKVAFSLNDEFRYTETLETEGGIRHTLHQLIDSIDNTDLKDMIKQSVTRKATEQVSSDGEVMEPHTADDYAWILSKIELTGVGYPTEGFQYAYFSMVNPLDDISTKTNDYFWTRSRSDLDPTYANFLTTFNRNYATIGQGNTIKSLGVAFVICL